LGEQIHEQGLGDGASASTLYRQALELTPGDATLVDRLVVLYERAGNLLELSQMLEAQAAQAQATGDMKRAASLRLKVADLYAGPLEEPTRAITLYRHIVDADAANVPARSALATLYMRDAAASQLAIEENRQLLKLDPTRAQAKVELESALAGMAFSADRAGVLMCGDVSVGLTMVLREDPNFATARLDNAEPLLQALRERADLQQILTYVLSDDFLRLRQRVALALP
jgi:tetratricopeptide (TPR) repeat protein